MPRVLKYLAMLAAGLLVFCVAGAAFLESRLFKDWLGDFLADAAKSKLRGELTLGRLEGNLFRRLELSQVLVKTHGDTALFAPKISITFSPRAALRKEVLLDSICIDSLYAVVHQLSDSSWNFSQLFVTDTSALTWVLHSDQTELRHARVVIRPLEPSPLLPQTIENLNARLAWTYADSAKSVHLREFNLRTRAPDFELRELSFALTQRQNELQLREVIIRTAQNRFAGGALYTRGTPRANVKLASAPLHFEEFNFAFPMLRIHGNPNFDVRTRLRGDSLRFHLAIREREQALDLQGFLSDWKKEPHYALAGTIAHFDASTWLQNPKWACAVNGNFEVEGRGFSRHAMALRGSAELHDCTVFKRNVQQVSWHGDYADGRLRSTLNVRGDLGEAFVNASIGDSLHAQNFNVRADFRRLYIPPLTVADSLQTILNLALAAQGRGLLLDTLEAKMQIALGPSLLAGVPLDSLWGGGEVRKKRIKVDTLNLRSPLGDFHLGGTFNRASRWALRFDGRVRDLSELQRFGFMSADTVAARGKFAGEVRGFSDSLKARGDFALEHLRFNDLAVDTLTGSVFLHRQDGQWQGKTHVHGENAQTDGLNWDNRFDLRASFVDSLAEVGMDFAQGDSLQGRLQALLLLADSLKSVAITDFDFRFKDQEWSTTQDTMRLLIGENSYQLRDVHLVSGRQAIHAEGIWDLNSELNVHCDLDSLDVGSWSELFAVPLPMAGSLNARVRLRGTARSPLLNGEIAVHQGRIHRMPYENLQAQFHYEKERFNWQVTLRQSQLNELTSAGFLPLNLSFVNRGKVLLPEDSMRIAVNLPAFDLSAFKAEFPDLQEATGKLEGSLAIGNTPASPSVTGALRLREGKLEVPRYGMRYTDVGLEVTLDDQRLVLNSLQFKRDKGTFTASGHAEYEKNGLQSRITATQIKLQANNVLLTNHRALELVVNSDVEVSGDAERPRFQGIIKIARARVDLPTFSEVYDEYEAEAQTAMPMLVAASAVQDCTAADGHAARKRKESSALYQNLRGNLKVEILRNTWLRSPALNVEISGELNVVKDGPNFEIFGPIEVLRGTYVLPGISKSFEVESGTLVFQGAADYNAELDLYAQHVFRTATREKKTLRAHITGQSSSPKFAFTLVEDNKEITETDALSYMIFGRSVEELTQSPAVDNANGNGANTNSNNAAREAVSGMLSDRLSRRLGQELGVDVLQLRGDESFQQLSFMVGKYITNDLFVSYQDQLGTSYDPNESAFSTITVEYEVARFLFLQLIKGDTKSTGFDAIIKFER